MVEELVTQRQSMLDEMKTHRQTVVDLKIETKQGLHDLKMEVAKVDRPNVIKDRSKIDPMLMR